jgi:hypothetical protein
LNRPLRPNGFTAEFLERARLPFRGACSLPCTFLISLMTDGAVASLPARGSLSALLRCTHTRMALCPGTPKVQSRNCPGLDSRDFTRS